jgi:hypothetical protein
MTFKLGPRQREWVRRLRSGIIPQHKKELRDNGDARCCLGVACDVFADMEGKDKGHWSGNEFFAYNEDTMRNSYSSSVLPETVMKWLGLRCDNGAADGKTYLRQGATCLTEMNDGGYTFSQIADAIEERAADLFEESR